MKKSELQKVFALITYRFIPSNKIWNEEWMVRRIETRHAFPTLRSLQRYANRQRYVPMKEFTSSKDLKTRTEAGGCSYVWERRRFHPYPGYRSTGTYFGMNDAITLHQDRLQKKARPRAR